MDQCFKNPVVRRENGTITIELTKGKQAVVDDTPVVCELLKKYKYHTRVTPQGNHYMTARIAPGATLAMAQFHRQVINAQKGWDVDHINGDPLDNRVCNLRTVSRRVNATNRTRLNKNNTTGINGLSYSKSTNQWRVFFNTKAWVQCSRSFSCAKYGFERARELAIACLEKTKTTLPVYVEAKKREVAATMVA